MHIYDKLVSIGYMPTHRDCWWVGSKEELDKLRIQQSMYSNLIIPDSTALAIKLLEEDLNGL